MKRILNFVWLFTFIVSLVLINSCKKSSSVNGLVSQTTEVYTNNGIVQTTQIQYTYDGQGRQIQAVSTGNTNSTTTYNYSTAGKVIKTVGSSTTTYTLNSQGLVYYDGISDFTYTNGYLTRQVDSTSIDSFVTNTVTNGNITLIVFSLNGTQIDISYQYTSVKDYRNYGLSFLGKTNTDNVLTQQTQGDVINYTYQYDSEGRVTQQTSSLSGGSTTDVFTYTYVSN